MAPNDFSDVLQGLFPNEDVPVDVSKYFSEAWDRMEPSYRVEVLRKLRQETDSIARVWELFQIMMEVLFPKEEG